MALKDSTIRYILYGVAVIAVIVSVIAVAFTFKEKFGAPDSFAYRGNYHGYNYGFGTNLVQSDWNRGSWYQPWVPLNQGLYDNSCEWSPRYIRNCGGSCNKYNCSGNCCK